MYCTQPAAAAFKRDGLQSVGFLCVRDSMPYRSRLAARVGACLRWHTFRLTGLRPTPAPAPTLREGVNVLLAGTEEIEEVLAYSLSQVSNVETRSQFTDSRPCLPSQTAQEVTDYFLADADAPCDLGI